MSIEQNLRALSLSVVLGLSVVSGAQFIQTAPAVAQAATVIASGEWTKKSFSSSGTWQIVEENGTRYVELSEDFRTRRAPDLKIFLSPTAATDTTGSNATDGSVLISPLQSNRGAQRYEIPASVDLSQYASILIHCEAYSKLWSASDLA